MATDMLHEKLSALIGAPSRMKRVGADPVSAAQVRRWLEAFGMDAPAGRGEARVPRAMLAAFSGRGLAETRRASDDIGMLTHALDGLGLLPAGVGIAQNYLGDIRIGDTITETTEVESVSPRKTTRLGAGYFLTILTRFADQAGAILGEQRIALLAYEAGPGLAPASASRQIAPPQDMETGETLPLLDVSLDRLGIILCAAACGDFAAGHYDPDIARARGFEDIFTDVYTAIGLAYRYVTGWAGREARVRAIDLRLGASFHAGDTLRLSGHVAKREASVTALRIRGLCRTGVHLRGNVTLS